MDVIRIEPDAVRRRDEVEAAWRWVDPILKGWKSQGSLRRAILREPGSKPIDRADRARRQNLARGDHHGGTSSFLCRYDTLARNLASDVANI